MGGEGGRKSQTETGMCKACVRGFSLTHLRNACYLAHHSMGGIVQ